MEFGLSHEQTLLRDSLAQFLADRAPLARVRRFAAESAANAATSAPTRADDITAGLAENPDPTRDQAVAMIAGNLCRCTGYHAIVDAVLRAAELRRERS